MEEEEKKTSTLYCSRVYVREKVSSFHKALGKEEEYPNPSPSSSPFRMLLIANGCSSYGVFWGHTSPSFHREGSSKEDQEKRRWWWQSRRTSVREERKGEE